jgi:membrane protein required for beta-lactamase induction
MRRSMNPVVRYLADLARSLTGDWDAFWYRPVDPTLLGTIRILTGLMLLYTHAVWGLALNDFFGRDSWLSEAFVRMSQADESAYSLWWLIPPGWIWPAFGVSMVILALFTIGYRTRVTSILSMVVLVSYAHRVPQALFGLDQINGMLILYLAIGYLAIGPGDRALSVDAWLDRRRRGEASPRRPIAAANLALRLIQVHMCVIYFFAGTSKLQGPAWWNGEAVWAALSNLEYQSFDLTWLAWHPRLLNLMTHMAVLWELSFCFLIWVPRLRPLMLAAAVATHLGIGAFLGMWTFGLIMLVGNMAFLPNEAVRRVVDSLIHRRRGTTVEATRWHVIPEAPVHWAGQQADGVGEEAEALSGHLR